MARRDARLAGLAVGDRVQVWRPMEIGKRTPQGLFQYETRRAEVVWLHPAGRFAVVRITCEVRRRRQPPVSWTESAWPENIRKEESCDA